MQRKTRNGKNVYVRDLKLACLEYMYDFTIQSVQMFDKLTLLIKDETSYEIDIKHPTNACLIKSVTHDKS